MEAQDPREKRTMRFPPRVYKALGRAATLHNRTANAQMVEYVEDGLRREGLLSAVSTKRIGIAYGTFIDEHGRAPVRIRATEADAIASCPEHPPESGGRQGWAWRGVPIIIDPTAVDPVAEGEK